MRDEYDGKPFGPKTAVSNNTALRARIRRLEDNLTNLRDELQTQARDVVALATGFARTDARIFLQNLVTATVHVAKTADDGHTICGWAYSVARCGGGKRAHRALNDLKNIPGTMMCDKCLTTERAIALAVHAAELSGDEV